MELIDSHCHLLEFRDKGTLCGILQQAKEAGVGQFITVGTSPRDWVPYREMAAAHRECVHYTVGLHPCYVDADWEESVSQISTFFMPPHAPVALGEIGLDYFHLPKDPVEAGQAILHQEAALNRQLELARELDLPVVIHSRNAFRETLDRIDQSQVNWEKVVFHCFSYGPEEIQQINERGGRASFTGILTYKNAAAIREALISQGLDKLMLETDCPYLTPEPHRGKSNEPAYLNPIAQCAAQVLDLPLEIVVKTTANNTSKFFGLT